MPRIGIKKVAVKSAPKHDPNTYKAPGVKGKEYSYGNARIYRNINALQIRQNNSIDKIVFWLNLAVRLNRACTKHLLGLSTL